MSLFTRLMIKQVLLMVSVTTLLACYYLPAFESLELHLVLGVAATVLALDCIVMYRFVVFTLDELNQNVNMHSALCRTVSLFSSKSRLFRLLKRESLILFYAFLAKYFPATTFDAKSYFSCQKSSNASDVFWIVAIAQLPTLPLFHYFLEQEIGFGAAWMITMLTLWSVVYYLAQSHAVRHIPTTISGDTVDYHHGLFWSAVIPIANIKTIRKVMFSDTFDSTHCFLPSIGSGRNVLMSFYDDVEFKNGYGMTKRKSEAVIAIDEPEAFIIELSSHLHTEKASHPLR